MTPFPTWVNHGVYHGVHHSKPWFCWMFLHASSCLLPSTRPSTPPGAWTTPATRSRPRPLASCCCGAWSPVLRRKHPVFALEWIERSNGTDPNVGGLGLDWTPYLFRTSWGKRAMEPLKPLDVFTAYVLNVCVFLGGMMWVNPLLGNMFVPGLQGCPMDYPTLPIGFHWAPLRGSWYSYSCFTSFEIVFREFFRGRCSPYLCFQVPE